MERLFVDDCIFCQIIQNKASCTKVWENDEYLAIKNKFPEAPIDILVMPKWHIEKADTRKSPEIFWNDFMKAIWEITALQKLDEDGYVLQNNGAGYNHLEHEHTHILSGMPKLH
ncbi:HIT domain-containing protein [bacterium]|nr:HIT domain-containing protein [bacterium]